MVRSLEKINFLETELYKYSGLILTMSPTAGASFLDISLPREVQVPPTAGAESESVNVLEHLRKTYVKSGTDTWPSKSAAWFLVHLITKVLVVPHGLGSGSTTRLHSGNTIPEIQKAYLPLARDLVCLHGLTG